MTKRLDPEEKAVRAAVRATLHKVNQVEQATATRKNKVALALSRAEEEAAKVPKAYAVDVLCTPVTATTYTGTETATTVSVSPLVARPAANEAQEVSRTRPDGLAWEAVAYNRSGKAWQWRCWFQGTVVGVVTWCQSRRRYAAAAMRKRIGMYEGQQAVSSSDASVPPCIDAVNAVSYVVVDLVTSGEAVEADQEALAELSDGPGFEEVQEASAALLRAHEARYEVDELDDGAVLAANQQVQTAIDVCEGAYMQVVQLRKTAEQRTAEAADAINASADAINAFNQKNAASGRVN